MNSYRNIIVSINRFHKLAQNNALNFLDQGYYAHFSDTPEHFGINPNRHKNIELLGGPVGIYAYEWKRDMLNGAKIKFAHNRKSVILFYPINPDKILDVDDYSEEDFNRDLSKLKNIVDPLLLETALKRHEKYTGKFDILKKNLSDAYLLPAGKLYYLISKIQDKKLFDPDEDFINYSYPGLHNFIFATEAFKMLGYDGFTDRHGLIHGSEPYQTVFFNPNNLKVIGTFSNPLIIL